MSHSYRLIDIQKKQTVNIASIDRKTYSYLKEISEYFLNNLFVKKQTRRRRKIKQTQKLKKGNKRKRRVYSLCILK